MKAIAYNIQTEEKELLVRANAKRYKLTLISNGLNIETSTFSAGKEIVIVSEKDILDRSLLQTLHQLGVRKIISRSPINKHIDYHAAEDFGIKIVHTNDQLDPEQRAWQTIDLLSQ